MQIELEGYRIHHPERGKIKTVIDIQYRNENNSHTM